MKKYRKGRDSCLGASLVEYGLLVALIAVVALAAVKATGRSTAKGALIIDCELRGFASSVVCRNDFILESCISTPAQALCNFAFGL